MDSGDKVFACFGAALIVGIFAFGAMVSWRSSESDRVSAECYKACVTAGHNPLICAAAQR